MSENENILKRIQFNIQNLNETTPVIIGAAQRAISMVWDKNVGEPIKVSLIFADRIIDVEGKDTGWSSAYHQDSDEFQFALVTMRERMKLYVSDDVKMLLVAAHEAQHKVQCYRGDFPRPSPTNYDMDKQYFSDKHETEAWEEALHVIKILYPEAQGRLEIGGRHYEVPKISKYSK